MHMLFGILRAPDVLCRGRLKTSVFTGRLLARYVLLRLKPSESVPRQRTSGARRIPKSMCIRRLPAWVSATKIHSIKKRPPGRMRRSLHAYLPKGRFPNHSVVHSSILNLCF